MIGDRMTTGGVLFGIPNVLQLMVYETVVGF